MPVRFGIVGCGAVTELQYIPALIRLKSGRLTCLLDIHEERALNLSKSFNIELEYVGKDLKAMFDHVDAVVVAVPNYLHFQVCEACIMAGKHVLCEKPLTITEREGRELVSLAKDYSVKLAVAHVRRFFPTTRKIRELIEKGDLGGIKSFNFEEGTIFSWPTVSGFFFDRKKAGGGVLMDIGVHVIDLLFWWIPYKVEYIKYRDDNLGGVEAFADVELELKGGIKGRIRLSRLSKLKNIYSIQCEHGAIEWNPFAPYEIYIKDSSKKRIKMRKIDPFKALLEDFIASILEDREPSVTGEEVLKTIHLIEECYKSRSLLPLKWLQGGRWR